MTATTDRCCPGCHGSGIEMSGVTYAGMSEYVGCHECGPECPDDCGCRASDDLTLIANEPVESCERCGAVLPPPYDRPEWAKSVAARHPGATQSPDGSQGAPEGPRGAEGATGPDLLAALGAQVEKARAARHATSSDVRSVSPARDAELVAYEAAAAAAYETGLLGGLSREERAARHAALARGAESVPSAAQIGAESITVDVRRWASHMADRLDQAEAENARMRQVAELRVGTWRDTAARLEGERDRARGTAATLEAENARLRAGIEALADQWEADPSNDRTAGPPQPEDYGMDLRALLAEGGE